MPTEVRKEIPYKVFPKVYLSLTVSVGKSMNVTIEKKAAFAVAGVLASQIESKDCPGVWDELYAKFDIADLKVLGNGQSLGVCSDLSSGVGLNYLAGYDVTDKKRYKSWA